MVGNFSAPLSDAVRQVATYHWRERWIVFLYEPASPRGPRTLDSFGW